jgi:hypothetical protein
MPTVFADNKGRKWDVMVNVSTVKRVRSLTSVDLMSVVEGKDLLVRLSSDPILLCDVLFAVVKPQADAGSVTDEDFGSSLAGDAIADAANALLEGIINFFPSPKRTILDAQLKKLKSFETAILQKAQERLDSPEMEAHIKTTIEREFSRPLPTFGESSTKTPESLV